MKNKLQKAIALCIVIITSVTFYTHAKKTVNQSEINAFFSGITYYDCEETLEKIMDIIEKKEKGMYLRFGDGDVLLATGRRDINQKFSEKVSAELQEAFALEDKNILKTLPLNCDGYGACSSEMCRGMKIPFRTCKYILNKAKKVWKNMGDIYTPWLLSYYATYYPEICIQFFEFLKDHNCFMFVGNQKAPTDIIHLLLGKQCRIISTPTKHSYDHIDRIEQECLDTIPNDGNYRIIVTAMGCAGRALQKRLWKKLDNVFLFDFGSLIDALCGWNTRPWIRRSRFDGKQFLNKMRKN